MDTLLGYDLTVQTQRYSIIDLQGFNGPPYCPALRAGKTLCLLYKNMLQIGYGSDRYLGSDLRAVYGVGPTEADPSWELNLTWNHGTMADIGNAGYEARFAENTIAAARAGGFNGVFLDDVHWRQWTGYPSAYPDQASWDAAVGSFLATVCTRLHSAGLYVVANIGPSPSADGFKPLMALWSGWLDGVMDEGVGRNNVSHSGSRDTGVWVTNRMAMIEFMQQHGKAMVGEIPADDSDLATIAYGIAMLLLVDDQSGLATVGVAGSAEADGSYYGHEVWTAVHERALTLGSALAPYQGSVTSGFYRRFAGGEVRLNPTSGTLVIDGQSVPAASALLG